MAEDLVKVAWARDPAEGALMRGLLENAGIPSLLRPEVPDGPKLGFGLLNPGGGSQQLMVRAEQAERARALLGETLVEDEEATLPEPVNAEHLADARGRRLRDYGVVGAYARMLAVAFVVFVVAFAVFLLVRAF